MPKTESASSPKPRRRHLLRWISLGLLAVASTVLVSSCNKVSLVYNHLDVIANYELRSFVKLTPEQQKDFDSRFERFWTWHRRTKLPQYALLLTNNEIAEHEKKTPSQLREQIGKFEAERRELIQQFIAYTAPLIATLDDAQVQSLLSELDRRAEKARGKFAKLSDEKRKEQRYNRAVNLLKEWVITVTPKQRRVLRLWADQAQFGERAETAYRDAQRRTLPVVLAQRHESDFALRLQQWAFGDDDHPDYSEQRQRKVTQRETLVGLLTTLDQLSSEEQHTQLNGRLEHYAEVFKQLAEQRR